MNRTVWVYFISRDSINGELSGTCHLWSARPIRVRHRYRVTYVAADVQNPCHIGEYKLQEIAQWFDPKRVPETDLQVFRVEMYPTERMLAEAK